MKPADVVAIITALAIAVTLVAPVAFRQECLTGEHLEAYEKVVVAALAMVAGWLGGSRSK